ncbi:hypothetical protein M9458_052114, partial [Cirrhinus mrigala]
MRVVLQFQGAVVSGKPELGSSPPLRGSLEQLVRSVPAREPSQDTKLAVQTNPEVGLERLRGYRIQFRCSATSLQRGLPHSGGAGNGIRGRHSLEEGGHRVVPSHDRESGFYSRSKAVEQLGHAAEVQVGQVVSQIGKFLRFAFRGEAYQYRVLPFDLALSPRTFTKCVNAALTLSMQMPWSCSSYIDDWLILVQSEQMAVQHRDVVLAHMKELGLRLNGKRSVLSALQRTTYLGEVWDSTTMQARLSHARIESILTAVAKLKEGWSLTVKQFQQLLGLMAAASNVMLFGLLYMRPLQWWLRTKEFSQRGNLFCMIMVTRRSLRALDMWKKPWILSQVLVFGVPYHRVTLATDASLTGWGAVMNGHPAHGLWSGRHLTWHISCLEMLAMFHALKHFLLDLISPHVLVYKLAHQILVWSQGKLLSLRAVHIPITQFGSRHPVEAGAEAPGMDASPRGGELYDLEESTIYQFSST